MPGFDDDRYRDVDTVRLAGVEPGAFFHDRYRIDDVLGMGSMARVLLATDVRDGGEVALKVLHPHKARREQVRLRFRREAEILRGLGHPGIVAIRDAGRSADGVEYLAMERLTGPTLRQYLSDKGSLPPKGFLPILVALADALSAAHEQGVIHRDLKPDNIFLAIGERPPARIVDFGLSLWASSTRVTKTGMVIGTPKYMSPEQIRSARNVDPRADIYALGVLCYEALGGSSPFPAEDAAQLLGCVVSGRTIPLEQIAPHVPEAVVDVIKRAMAVDKNDRFETAGAFAEAYAAALGLRTGRSDLMESGDLQAIFDGASGLDDNRPLDPSEFELPSSEPPPPAAVGIPTFTTPPGTLARAQEPVSLAPEEEAALGEPMNANPPWLIWVIALAVVIAASAGVGLGLRAALGANASDAAVPASQP